MESEQLRNLLNNVKLRGTLAELEVKEGTNKNGIAYVFSMEQVNAIKSQVKYNIDINYDGSFYILKNEETQSKRKKRKPNNIDKNEEV